MHDDLTDAAVARRLALKAFGEESGAVVYVDREPRDPGTVAVGPEDVRTESPGLIVFRDELPGANWMHRCSYALVDIETGDVIVTASADRPPRFGRLPVTWIVAADPDGQADLLHPADKPREEP